VRLVKFVSSLHISEPTKNAPPPNSYNRSYRQEYLQSEIIISHFAAEEASKHVLLQNKKKVGDNQTENDLCLTLFSLHLRAFKVVNLPNCITHIYAVGRL